MSADEVFVTNAVAGVMPVVRIDGATIADGAPGKITRALGQELKRAMLSPDV
jgi:branched-subunit amino acid aminotransferase/4-amino-4-deoxychorismate lyase